MERHHRVEGGAGETCFSPWVSDFYTVPLTEVQQAQLGDTLEPQGIADTRNNLQMLYNFMGEKINIFECELLNYLKNKFD